MNTIRFLQIVATTIAAFAVTGCSTPATLRNSTPDIELSSVRMAKDVAICITDRWENGAGSLGATVPVNMRESARGYTVLWLNGTGGAGMLADVDSAGAGSRTRYYRGGVLGAGTFESSLRDCQ